MTVSTEVNENTYTGNGTTTVFPYQFRIFKKSDLVVQTVDLDENVTTLTLDTNYTVTGAGGYRGGNVTLITPLASGWRISIARELELTQDTDLRNQGKFFAETHEDVFDKLTMLIQQIQRRFGLSLRKPTAIANWYDALNNYIRNLRDPRDPQDAATKKYVDSLASGNLSRTLRVPEQINELPAVDGRKNKMLAFDNDGRAIVVVPLSGSASDVLIELAKPTGADKSGTTSGRSVQGELDYIEGQMYQDPLSKWPNGGTLKIKQGVYNITEPLVLDYANFSPKFPGVAGIRSHYEGENMPETIFNCSTGTFSIQMKGDNSYLTQRVHAYDYIGNLTLKGSSLAYGLLVQGKAYSKIDNITAINFPSGEGIRLENFITSELSNIYSQYNNIGIRVIGQNPVGSDLNAVVFNRVSASNNSKYGILGERWGASNVINGLTCEGNGTMGDSNSGGMLINIQGNITVPAVVLNSPYFELNKGGADLQIVNTSATKPVTVIINGGLFNRGSNVEYTTNNISVASAGGKTKVILIGVAFANSSGYIPSVDRPYWVTSNNCEVIPIGCIYDDETAMAQTSQSMVYSGRVTSTGQIGISSPGFTAQTSSAGIYTVTYNQGTLGRDSGTYIVSVTPYAANSDVTIETTNLSLTAFRVVVRNSAGAGVACGFNFMVSRII